MVAVFLAAIFVAPNFVDWNQYRDELTAYAKSFTGRELEIKGDIKFAILPSPILAIKDLRIANSKGPRDADIASLESLEIHLALTPLLTKNIQVTNLKLGNPVINLENASGSKDNLPFRLNSKNKTTITNNEPVGSPQRPGNNNSIVNNKPVIAGFKIQINNFLVENGTINYRNISSGHIETIDKLNGRLRLASLNGPIDAEGTAVVRKIPLSFSVSVGQIVQERTLPINITTNIIPGSVKTSFNGFISNIQENPQIKGMFTVNGSKLDKFLSAIGGTAELPVMFSKPFSANAKIALDLNKLEVKDLTLQFAKTKGSGSANVTFGSTSNTNVTLSLKKLDLDDLLKVSPNLLQTSKTGKLTGTAIANRSDLPPFPSSFKKNSEIFSLQSLPKAMNASFNLFIEALTHQNATIRNATLNASLANREITLSQFSALLPGNSDLALFGFITQRQGGPTFDGTVDLTTNDLRGLLKWKHITIPQVPKDRLRNLKLSGKIKANKKNVELSNMKLQLDGTKIRGTSKLAFKARSSLTLGLAIDKLNLDSYFPKSKQNKKLKSGEKQQLVGRSTNPIEPAPNSQTGSNTIPFSGLGFLSNLDVSLESRINSLTIYGLRASKINFDAKLNNGNFVLNDFSFKSVAGIQGKISGKLSGLAVTSGIPNPVLNDFRINFRGNSLGHSLKILGIKPPIQSLSSGAIRLKAILNGKPNRLKFSANLSMQKGNFNLRGKAQPFDNIPSITGQMKLIHPDLAKLLRTFNISYSPTTSKNNRVNLSGELEASGRSLSLSQITGNLFGLKLEGDLKVKIDKPRPSIIANLATSAINLDNFLPSKTLSYFFEGVNREYALKIVSPSRVFYNTPWSNTTTHKNKTDEIIYVAKKNSGRWSGSPIDISFLNKFDGKFALETPQLKFNKLKLKSFKLRANLQNGSLKIREATGNLFEGKLKLDGKVTTSNKNSQYQTQFTLNRMNLPLALRALEDKTLKSGTLDLTGNYHTKGRSVADLVSHLNGSGSFSFNGVDISSGTKRGSAFSSISILLSSLNKFAGVIDGKGESEKAKLHGLFQVVNGIAKFKNINLTSGIGSGTAKGVIDFPNWRLDATGTLNLSQNVLMQALMEQAGPKTIPFHISGLLDQPNVKLDTSKFSKSGIRIPGKLGKKIDQILKKKGVRSILQEFLPVSPSISSPRQPSTKRSPQRKPKTKQNAPPSNLKPEDILKNILRGLSR